MPKLPRYYGTVHFFIFIGEDGGKVNTPYVRCDKTLIKTKIGACVWKCSKLGGHVESVISS